MASLRTRRSPTEAYLRMQKAIAMSKQKSNTNEVLKYATIAAEILRDLTQTSHTPFLQNAAGASLLLLNEINVRVFFPLDLSNRA